MVFKGQLIVYTNTKNTQEATYFDNGVAHVKSRFMRVLTQDHSLGFLAVDGQIVWSKPGWEILKIFVKRQFQCWNVCIGCIGGSVISVEPQGRELNRKIRIVDKYTLNTSGPRRLPWGTPQYTGSQIIFSHVLFLFCSIFPPRTNTCIEFSSTSVACIKISWLGKKMTSQLRW